MSVASNRYVTVTIPRWRSTAGCARRNPALQDVKQRFQRLHNGYSGKATVWARRNPALDDVKG